MAGGCEARPADDGRLDRAKPSHYIVWIFEGGCGKSLVEKPQTCNIKVFHDA